MSERLNLLHGTERFVDRHIGPTDAEIATMLAAIGYQSLDALIEATIPSSIRRREPLELPAARTESAMLRKAEALAALNKVQRSFIGMGYSRSLTPPVIQRNILENPGWYTQYTPYQAEISQGRLEALLNFQTMVTDLTGLEIANASLLDEGTAAAEAMTLAFNVSRKKRHTFAVAQDCHPQTIDVIKTRACPLEIDVLVVDPDNIELNDDVFGLLLQYPGTDGQIRDYRSQIQAAHDNQTMVVMAADILALTMLTPPGELGADVAVGSTQRFGVPLGYGGPHAAYFATREVHKRRLPGRLVGVSRDADGHVAYRLALQTREQHIRRDRATSNICTSQVLLAVMASMYAVYHGPQGLRRIAERVRLLADIVASGAKAAGLDVGEGPYFDTIRVLASGAEKAKILARAAQSGIELRQLDDGLTVSLDEATTVGDLEELLQVLSGTAELSVEELARNATSWPEPLNRTSEFLTHPVFNSYHSEHEMLRYMHRLQSRDLSLTTSMIPLGSCTMKLNGTAEMMPITLPGFAQMHPFTDVENASGYAMLIEELAEWLGEITGLPGVSLQPNAGSQGEYAGLLTIKRYLEDSGQPGRNVCLIPSSAHGTNPASAVMAGMKVVVVACDDHGNIDLADLRAKASENADQLAAIMVTYPSTHGVFEEEIVEICQIVHDQGGQVYMDGANMNAQVGLCRPGDFGVDVCHLNLHKTFCIPHGGGGPGVGPIAVAVHLEPYLPGHGVIDPTPDTETKMGPVAAAPWGSAGILPISWMYIALMGSSGMTRASQVAILNANYLMTRLSEHYDVLYTGVNGTVAHEFILDLRALRKSTGVTVADVAKRLMDYGFHAPTMSWPVEGTLMVEPTESETLAELDRFVDALVGIREEVRRIENGVLSVEDSPLRHAPHTSHSIAGDWDRAYSREEAAFPVSHVKRFKYWPPIERVDDAYGDRNVFCTCPPSGFLADE